jgi:class 3 adenylate cyclase
MLGLERLGVQSRFILLMLLVSLGSICAVGYLGYRSAKESLTRAVQNQLQSVRHSKTAALMTLLESLRDQVISLSDSKLVSEAMTGFKEARGRLAGATLSAAEEEELRRFYAEGYLPRLRATFGGEPEPGQYLPPDPVARYLQFHYLDRDLGRDTPAAAAPPSAADTSFGTVHAALQSRIDRAARLFGYEDVILIDDETLDIVYTLRKRPDFGTNLRTGPYASSNLAKAADAISRARDRDAYKVVDTELYRPNLGQAVGFVLSPVFSGQDMIGILALEFPIERLTKLLTGGFQWEREGLGRSGECYLVGPDRTMRSRSRFMFEDPQAFIAVLRKSPLTASVVDQIERQGTVLNQLPVRTPGAEAALNGQEGLAVYDDYRGLPVLSSYGPLDLDSLRWGVIAEMDVAEAYEPINDYARRALLTATALGLATAVLALVSSALLVRPLRQLTAAAARLGSGAAGVRVDLKTRDEFGELATVFNAMSASLDRQRRELEERSRENRELLLNILPAAAVEQRRGGDARATREFADVSVLVAEFQGVDDPGSVAAGSRGMEMMGDLVAACDEAAERCGVEKVRAVGAMYLAVCGLSVSRPDHAARAVAFARELSRLVAAFNREHDGRLGLSVGVNSGPVVGGVMGRQKFLYDLWGDTVSIATRLASGGAPAIRVTRPVHDRLRDLHTFAGPEPVELPGRGAVETWTLEA